MCVIYLTRDENLVRKNGGRMQILQAGERLYSVPVEDITSVVVCSSAQLTTQAIYSLLENGSHISYLNGRGEVVGSLGDEHASLERMLVQQRCFADGICQRKLIREVLREKMMHQMQLLRLYAKRRNSDELKALAADVGCYRDALEHRELVDELRGLEGMASRRYFDGFPWMLRQDVWAWQGRNRRPPRDPVNSLLSFGYAVLEREVREGIAGARLDCRIGFLHSNDGRKDSLVYDLMELFRQDVSDRFVLRLLNNRELVPVDFHYEDEACLLSDAARRKWFMRYEEYMQEPHTGDDSRCWREIIHDRIARFAEDAWRMKILAS